MKKIKAIFVDIDGTLKNNQDKISENTKKIIKEIVDKGIYIILASGRNYTITKEIAEEIKASTILICNNGSLVVDYHKNKIILEKHLDILSIKKIFEYSKTHGCILTAHELDKSYIIEDEKDFSDKIINLVIESKNYERMHILKYYFQEKIPSVTITNSSKALIENRRIPNKLYYHDISSPQTSKGNAVLEVMDYLNLKEDEVMCIGDSDNDISMFLVCNTKIAMGNSTKNLKNYSTKVIKSNDEDGLYLFLKEFVDNDYKVL